MAGWSHDYCLSCDNQTSEGAYCSEECRLADFQRGQAQLPVPIRSKSYKHKEDDSSSRSSSLSSNSSASAPSYSVWSRSFKDRAQFSLPTATAKTAPTSPAPASYNHISSYRQSSIPVQQKTKHSPTLSSFDQPFSDPLHQYPSQHSSFSSTTSHLPSTTSTPSVDTDQFDVSNYISESARRELRRYDDAFDNARLSRRKPQRHPTV